jgi:hypothetical protein
MSIKSEIKEKYEILEISDFFSFLRSKFFFITTLGINNSNSNRKLILLLDELEYDSQKQKEIYTKYIDYIAGLVTIDPDSIYTNMALDLLGMSKDEIVGKIEEEEEEEDDDERDIIEKFIEQNPEARKEDFFQFLKTNGFEIDDELFYISKKGELYSSLNDYEDFVLKLFVKEYKDVLTIYKTVTNTEDLVTCKEKPSEIEVKKMRKKFIEI